MVESYIVGISAPRLIEVKIHIPMHVVNYGIRIWNVTRGLRLHQASTVVPVSLTRCCRQ